ncbi:23S rRNA (uridine(2552)-2'-O)-methyltransferase [Methanosarcina sp. Mfa9]|uniref:23S rRNA (uridine(2552)-2'-O)-methyltransferase n=1 Tax=Methanosarcina sp. Mfa9 TaxID=3439063 RepID=UPI003F835703
MARDRRDYYYHQAKEEGYRSRASFKLKQINEKYKLIKRGDSVVDLGAAPGGWLQIAKELSGGKVLGVDLQRIAPIDGVKTVRGDINADSTIKKIIEVVGQKGADVVICDAAPNLSGNWSYDHARSIELTTSALECAKKILKPNGNFVVKVFQGDMFKDYMDKVKDNFVRTTAYSPKASRSQSAETYIIGKKFLTAPMRRGDEFTVEIEKLGSSGDGAVLVDGFVVFVKEVEVGEKVKIKIQDVKPNFAFADVEERLGKV